MKMKMFHVKHLTMDKLFKGNNFVSFFFILNIENVIFKKIGDVKMENNINDQELIKAFIGKNSEKFLNRKFNFSAFLFTVWYIFYRKMLLPGLVFVSIFFSSFYLITIPNNLPINMLSNLDFLLIIILILSIACLFGMFFNNVYLSYIKREIIKIKKFYPNASQDELINFCKSKGGTSIVSIIIGYIFSILFGGLIIFLITRFF